MLELNGKTENEVSLQDIIDIANNVSGSWRSNFFGNIGSSASLILDRGNSRQLLLNY